MIEIKELLSDLVLNGKVTRFYRSETAKKIACGLKYGHKDLDDSKRTCIRKIAELDGGLFHNTRELIAKRLPYVDDRIAITRECFVYKGVKYDLKYLPDMCKADIVLSIYVTEALYGCGIFVGGLESDVKYKILRLHKIDTLSRFTKDGKHRGKTRKYDDIELVKVFLSYICHFDGQYLYVYLPANFLEACIEKLSVGSGIKTKITRSRKERIEKFLVNTECNDERFPEFIVDARMTEEKNTGFRKIWANKIDKIGDNVVIDDTIILPMIDFINISEIRDGKVLVHVREPLNKNVINSYCNFY